jgi:hypothetical protein
MTSLHAEEKAWRLRSRATWLKSGDSNSKYFHNVASYNRNKKLIWSIKNSREELIRGQDAIKDEAVSFFKNLYTAPNNLNLLEQCSSASLYPSIISAEEDTELYKPVTLSELKGILHHFKKERSPGPDGWTSEFFIHFFDLVGEDLLQMVEDTRLKGKIHGGTKCHLSGFDSKRNKPALLQRFRPISLCNLIYKLISKVISNRIKPFLDRCISAEQLGFLKGRRIQDAIGAAHECIHSIKQKKSKGADFKIRPQKSVRLH